MTGGLGVVEPAKYPPDKPWLMSETIFSLFY